MANNYFNYFETHVKYDKTMENGTQKMVDEAYLVDAMSFTEAESRIIKEMTPFISGEFTVSAVKKPNISELIFDQTEGADRWYRAKVMFITLDEKTGTEKSVASVMLIQAKDFKSAVANLDTAMKGTMSDWELHTLAETKILDVFMHGADSDNSDEV